VAFFQLEGSSTEESEFERVRFSEYRWRYSKGEVHYALQSNVFLSSNILLDFVHPFLFLEKWQNLHTLYKCQSP
jgi:hypothetical protein